MEETYNVNAITLNLTQSCNLRCSYCFTKGKSETVMPYETARKSIDFVFSEANLIKDPKERKANIAFWGGEPLLEWEMIKELTLYAEKTVPSGIQLILGGTTNGVLFTRDKFPFMKEHNLCFMVSFDGTPETHNKYRKTINGEGTHEIIKDNILVALKYWPELRIRQSTYPESVHRFYEDMKYCVEMGLYYNMFSPVYEFDWQEHHWKTWKEQCMKVVDLIREYKSKGITITLEHFNSFCKNYESHYPCGAGRHYIGIDTDGSFWPCHRFSKFDDNRPWQEKEMCLGHIDHGFTKPELRQQFIDYKPEGCENCIAKNSPCQGGCYAMRYDLTGNFIEPFEKQCKYSKMQYEVSKYLAEKIPGISGPIAKDNCVCYNMCYSEGTPNEIIDIDSSGIHCHCNNTNYEGLLDKNLARPLKTKQINPLDIVNDIQKLDQRILLMEKKLDKILKKLEE